MKAEHRVADQCARECADDRGQQGQARRVGEGLDDQWIAERRDVVPGERAAAIEEPEATASTEGNARNSST
jgi:hypothetical protein